MMFFNMTCRFANKPIVLYNLKTEVLVLAHHRYGNWYITSCRFICGSGHPSGILSTFTSLGHGTGQPTPTSQ